MKAYGVCLPLEADILRDAVSLLPKLIAAITLSVTELFAVQCLYIERFMILCQKYNLFKLHN